MVRDSEQGVQPSDERRHILGATSPRARAGRKRPSRLGAGDGVARSFPRHAHCSLALPGAGGRLYGKLVALASGRQSRAGDGRRGDDGGTRELFSQHIRDP